MRTEPNSNHERYEKDNKDICALHGELSGDYDGADA